MFIYIGNGAFVLPYPARDLSAEEVKEFGEEALLATGLYTRSTPSVAEATSPINASHSWESKKNNKEK